MRAGLFSSDLSFLQAIIILLLYVGCGQQAPSTRIGSLPKFLAYKLEVEATSNDIMVRVVCWTHNTENTTELHQEIEAAFLLSINHNLEVMERHYHLLCWLALKSRFT